jgi:hypothetical protein
MLFLIGLGLLAAALAFGIAAMAPGVDPKMHDWLNPVVVLRLKDAASDETAYEKLAEALAKGLQGDPPKTEPQHVSVLKKRRRLIQFQIALLGFAAISIGASLIVETGGR